MKRVYRNFLSLALLLILIISAGCAKTDEAPVISLSSFEEQEQDKQPDGKEKTLRVAISAMTSAKQSIVDYDEMLKYIEENLNVKVELIQRKTYAEVNELMKSGQVDLAFVCTTSYVKGHEDFGMEILVAPRVRGDKNYQSYIIVSKDKGINSFADLNGKKFAFSDPWSTTGRMYPLALLKNLGQTPESYFKEYMYTYSHDNSIKAVYEGLADGAAVDSNVFHYILERNAEYAARLRVVDQSSRYAIPPVVVRPGIEPKLREQLQDLFLNMHKNDKGRAILINLSIDEFVLQDDKAYDSVRELLNVVNN